MYSKSGLNQVSDNLSHCQFTQKWPYCLMTIISLWLVPKKSQYPITSVLKNRHKLWRGHFPHIASLYQDTVEAQRVCDIGTDHYCSKACNRCPDSQNVIMLVGGRKSGNNWYLNPRFFPLNGSLPACLDSTKSDIHSSLSQIRTPAIFVNQSEDFFDATVICGYSDTFQTRLNCFRIFSGNKVFKHWKEVAKISLYGDPKPFCDTCQGSWEIGISEGVTVTAQDFILTINMK